MATTATFNDLVKLVDHIRMYPGHRDYHYARLLGVQQKQVKRWLILLERNQVFFAEDDNGGLVYIDGFDEFEVRHKNTRGDIYVHRPGTYRGYRRVRRPTQ